jgi:DNA-binding CsgD family transcriptional regulator
LVTADSKVSIASKRLVERVLHDVRPVTVVRASAGFGKTWLLKALMEAVASSTTKWVFYDDHDTPPDLVRLEPGHRYVIAMPNHETLPCLDRLRLYGQVLDLNGSDLVFPFNALTRRDWDRSAGWPLLLSPAADEQVSDPHDARFTSFLADYCLADLTEAQVSTLVLGGSDWPSWLTERLPPLAHPSTLAYRRVQAALPGAIEKWLLRYFADPARQGPVSGALAQALTRRLDHLEAVILKLLEQGQGMQAVALFREAGGWFLYYRLGHDAFLRLVCALEGAYTEGAEELVISRAFVMIKVGDVAWALQFLARHFGEDIRDVLKVLSAESSLSLRVKLFRITVLIYEDVAPTDRLLNALFDIGRDLPLGAPEQRGSFYNAMLEFFLRLRRYEEADGMAEKAIVAYRQADYPILCFYIALHQSVLSLLTSDFNRMGQSLQLAADMLGNVGFESPGDQRILDLVRACMAYEIGEPDALLAFLDRDLSGLMEGELWPSLADIAIYYGSHALSVHMSTRAGLRFLERWSMYQPLDRQFRLSLEVRKAQILQNGNGWGEAVRLLTPLSAGFNRVWIESAEEALARLSARNEITLALSWLRQIAYERPTFLHLDRKLEAMLANPHLLVRQEIAATIWLAFVCRHLQQKSKARSLLRQVFDLCAGHGGLTVLAEERPFLDHLLQDKRMADYVMAATPARAILRRLDKGRQSRFAAARTHLTQQELKILTMLGEGASNKLIARNCGIAEPTVKFHLKNVYRKLGCVRRHEAIAAAKALGWIR